MGKTSLTGKRMLIDEILHTKKKIEMNKKLRPKAASEKEKYFFSFRRSDPFRETSMTIM